MRRLALLIALGLLLAACRTAEPVDAPVDAGDRAPSDTPGFTILWAGDTLLADAAQPQLDARGYDWPFVHLASTLQADFTVINLEGPITTDATPFDPDQRWSYNAQPESADALAEIGVDAAGLANNHALDRGPNGVEDTIAALDGAGIRAFGAGLAGDAEAPLLIETPHGIVGVVAFGEDYGTDRVASSSQSGTLTLTPTAVQRGLTLARQAGARWVVAFVHWGPNYSDVEEQQRDRAQRFADAGYDLVVGHGAHMVQNIELIDGMPVFYSLGNFIFGTPGRYGPDAPGISILLTTVVGADGIRSADIRCLLTDNEKVAFQPRPCPAEQARTALSDLHRDVQLDGHVATLHW